MGATEYTVGGFWVVAAILVGLGAVMLGPTPQDFRRARICFVIAGLTFIAGGIVWGMTTDGSVVARLLIVGLTGAVGAVGINEGLRFLAKREAISLTEANESGLPSPSVASTNQSGGQIAASISNSGPVFNAPVTIHTPSIQKIGPTPASSVDGNLLGFSALMTIRMDDLTKLSRKYVFEFATPEGSRAAFYLSASDRFTFSVTDLHHEMYPIEVVIGPDGIPLNQFVILWFEAASTSNASFLRVFVNDKIVAVRDLDFPIDLGSRNWMAGTIGADITGQSNGAFAMTGITLFTQTIPAEKRTTAFKNLARLAGIPVDP
jgi:hypothetical protein